MLDQLRARSTPGERLLARLGPRGFSRPRVAISARIFKKYRVTDPWDPQPGQVEDPIELGPVSVRLGERRTVAPHLAPPEPPKKKVVAPVDPVARFRPKPRPEGEASSAPKPAPKPAAPAPPPPPAPSSATSELGREFGARDQRQPLRRPIPMRPDRAPPGDAPAAPAPSAAPTLSRSVPRAGPARASQAPSDAGANAGRFRMKPTSSSGPVVVAPTVEAPPPEPDLLDEPAAPPPPPPPPPPPRTLPGKSGGLDDLFGLAAAGGRMGLSRRKDKVKDEEPQS